MVRRHAARAAANERFRRTGGRWADLLYTRSLVVQVLDLVERGCEMERRRAATTTKRATAGPKMSSARQPRVELSTPERGWITFSLDVDGHHFEEQLWHVPVDFVTNLASAVAGIAEGRGATAAEASAESIGRYLLEFTDSTATDTLTIVIRHWPSWTSRTTGGTTILDCQAPRLELLRAFWRGFQRLRGRCDATEFERQWGTPLPTRAIDSLGEHVRASRPKSED
jgi:hypothetical protein